MIKLFRNTHKKLLREGKTANYIKYAIGEIFLVVIGILIALSINNWNTNKNKKTEEHLALINLKQDFNYNKGHLDTLILESNFFIEQGLKILTYTGTKTKPPSQSDFNKLINDLASTPHFYPQNGFLDDLMNSGRLNIITNSILRNRLSSWKPIQDYIKYREDLLTHYNQDIINYIIENGSWLNVDEVSNSSLIFPKSGFNVDNRVLLLDLKFENMTENHINFLQELKENQLKAQKLIVQILSEINNDLEQ